MKKLALLLVLFVFQTTAHAADYTYNCKFVKGDDLESDLYTLVIKDGGQSMEFTEVGSGSTSTLDADLDPTYKPRFNKDSVRFYVNQKKTPVNDEYTPEFIVQKQLLTGGKALTEGGSKGGVLKYQARGEGYFGGMYSCQAKAEF
jgi:hypothetical protein